MSGTVHRIHRHAGGGPGRAAAREVIDVELLMRWAIRDEYAHIHAEESGLFEGEAAAAGHPLRRASADGCAQLQRVAGLGIRPDGGVGMLGGHCHPDAEAAYLTAKRELVTPDFLLILGYAKAGERPEWGAHIRPIEAQPRLNERMKPMVLRPGGKGDYCPVRYDFREAEIEAWRMLYRAWWLALRRLCYALRVTGALKRHEAVGPAAPEAPWET